MVASPPDKRTVSAIAAISLFLLGYAVANPFFVHRLIGIDTIRNKIIFVVIHAAAILCLLGAAFCSKKMFYALATVSFLSILLDNSFFLVKHYAITLDDLSVLLSSVGNITDALLQFRDDIIKAFATASVLLLSMILLRRLAGERPRAGRMVLALGGASLCFYLTAALAKGEPALVALPSNYTLLFGGLVLSADKTIQEFKSLKPILATRRTSALLTPAKRIILIIDESVEGARFWELNKQPFVNAVDFGMALSGANCSASSNLILRVGPDDSALPDTILVTQTLFELAKQSKFKTIYFDLQGVLSDTAVRDYFSNRELAAVDQVYRRNEFGKKRFEHDMAFANRFADLVSKEDKVFAIVNKMGSHFPYSANLPPDLLRASDSYGASMTFSTIDFLHKIDSTLPDSTLVFYTSDHGQNFLAKSTHCNGASDSVLSEWRVPLIVFLSKDLATIREMLNQAWDNRASHFEVSETIRVILGYQPLFSKTLFDPPGTMPPQPYKAYFGPIKGLLGRPASFRTFDRPTVR